jgi:hypothetical protein
MKPGLWNCEATVSHEGRLPAPFAPGYRSLVDRSVPSPAPSEADWRCGLDDIVAIDDPETANRAITNAHHRLSVALDTVLGPGSGANFHTWAVWGSREAGRTIERRDIPGLRWRVALFGAAVGATLGTLLFGVVGGLVASFTVGWFATFVAQRELAQARRAISHGNRIVLDEIGGVTARFVARCAGDGAGQLEAFLATLRPGATSSGGQDLLRGAFAAYHRARTEHDPSRRHQLVFAGNCLAVWHEHVRLQHDIAAALPHLLRRAITRRLLHFSVGAESLHVGRDLAPVERDTWPSTLANLEVPLAVAVVATMRDRGRLPDQLEGSAAADWTVLHERMDYIVDLFRSRHLMVGVFDVPYPVGSPDPVGDRSSAEKPQQPSPVVALDDDARDVGRDRVADHRGRQPPGVPSEEDRAERGDRPVGTFGPARLNEKALEVRAVMSRHASLRETTAEQRARLREGVLPGLDAQDPLVGACVALEAAQNEQPVAA